MHYQHLIALAQLRHEEYQEYAREAARPGARRHARRWRRLRPRLVHTAESRYRRDAGSDASAVADASDSASAIAS